MNDQQTEYQEYVEHRSMSEDEERAYYGRSTAELDVEAGIEEKKKEKSQRLRRAPLSLSALVVIGVVAIVIAPQLVWLVSISLRPDEVTAAAPQQSEAVTISAISGMLGMVGGYALARRNSGGDDGL